MTPKRRGFGCRSAVIDPDASGRRVADVCGLGSNCVCHRAVCPPSSRPGRAAQHGNGILQRQSGKRRSPWGRTGCHPKGWEASRERRRRGLAGRGCEHGAATPELEKPAGPSLSLGGGPGTPGLGNLASEPGEDEFLLLRPQAVALVTAAPGPDARSWWLRLRRETQGAAGPGAEGQGQCGKPSAPPQPGLGGHGWGDTWPHRCQGLLMRSLVGDAEVSQDLVAQGGWSFEKGFQALPQESR